jgi:hypothetical protein
MPYLLLKSHQPEQSPTADYVLYYDMHSSATSIMRQPAQPQAFRHDPLSSECRIAMQLDAEDPVS